MSFFKDTRGFLNIKAIKEVIQDFYSDPNFIDF